jgi:DNA integrity scanning protein DisA with diadenylate cyclase activity
MAAITIEEMQKRMDEASENIGKAQAVCEGKMTVLKMKSNCMEPDGSVMLPEKAMLIAESVIDLEGKRLISEFYLEYRQIL